METNKEMKTVENGKENGFKKTIKKMFNKDNEVLSAEAAWLYSTYCNVTSTNIEDRIRNKQKDITAIIKSKFLFNGNMYDNRFSSHSYHCVIDLEEDLIAHKDEIFKPFIDNGFKIINLSEKFDEINGDYVFLISWKNVFRDKMNK